MLVKGLSVIQRVLNLLPTRHAEATHKTEENTTAALLLFAFTPLREDWDDTLGIKASYSRATKKH